MMPISKFFTRFIMGILIASIPALVVYRVMRDVGEVGIGHVVARQLAQPNGKVLFLSGINQQAYPYKMELLAQADPSVIAIGSSRAMQVRGEFIKGSFTNLGGAIQGITDLEVIAQDLAERPKKIPFIFLFVDPWWFNTEQAANGGARQSDFPNVASPSLMFAAAKLLRSQGNWFAASKTTPNLGIQSILTGTGFARDGSYYYTSFLNGSEPLFDARFAETLSRIKAGNNRFQKAAHPGAPLLARACVAIAQIRASTGAMVVIAPPFPDPIAQILAHDPGYAYMNEAYAKLDQCVEGGLQHYASVAPLAGSSDCEFVDGLHGGDVVYARMLMDIAGTHPQAKNVLDTDYMATFIQANSGYAGGTLRNRPGQGKETDFLKLGCKK